MKIAYFTDINLSISSGVEKKLRMQTNAWKAMGHEVKFFSVPSEVNQGRLLDDDAEVTYFTHPFAQTPYKGLNVYLRRILVVNKVINALIQYQPDIVYVREMLWFPGLGRIFSKFKIIVESNTLLLPELKAIAHPLVYRANKIMIPSVYRHVNGLVCVTQEILDAHIDYKIPHKTVIANGADTTDIPHPFPVPDNDRPKVVFVGSPGMDWHGLIHFQEMAVLTPQADFYLAGPEISHEGAPVNFYQCGYLQRTELLELYKKMDIAVGTLALYFKSMKEACPLKVREYFLIGLPMILGFKDTDLSGTEFVLEIGNNSNGVRNSIADIHAFINKWKGKRIDVDKYKYLIDSIQKEHKRLELFAAVAAD